jgi:chromate transport protein ChrA
LKEIGMIVAMTPAHGRICEVVVYFLRLGLLGFGGPVALVGQMERELVAERKWLSKEQMREAIAVCQSLPGPLAIQVGIYVSYLRAGFWGAWAGGWTFIFPNFVIVAALGALYVHLGDLQPVNAVFYGVSPAVIALILHSCYRLAKLGMEDWPQWAIAAVCLLWRGDRNDPGRLRPARTDRHRRLADRSHRGGVTGSSLPLESEQSTADGCDGGDWPHRVPAAAADMGDGQIASGNRFRFSCH